MATDITIENAPAPRPVAVADFERSSLSLVCRAVAVAIDDEPAAAITLATAAHAALDDWDHIGFDDEPTKAIYLSALRTSDRLTHKRALQVGHHVLGWTAAETALLLHVDLDVVHATLGTGTDYDTCRQELQDRCATASVAIPNLTALHLARQRRQSRRRHVGAAATVLLVIIIGAAVASRVEPTLVTAAPRPAATVAAESARQTPTPSAATTALVASPELPTLVTTDGHGGFVGAIASGSPDSRTATFVQSSDGLLWYLVRDLTLDPGDGVTRLERRDGRYFAWLENREAPSSGLRLAVSDDLETWQPLSIEPNAPQPFAMTFNYSIADVAVSGADILAMVALDIEIDFAALSLAESYTCGHEIDATSVVVKLCNGGAIDVLSFSAATTLPPRTTLFVSTAGGPFMSAPLPFGRETATQLSSAQGRFGLADETGLRFATSVNGTTWESLIGDGGVPFSVQGAATNDAGQTVGVSVGITGPTLLFASDGLVTEVTSMTDIVGEEPRDYTTTVAPGVAGWVVTLEQAAGTSWVLHSPDGLTWRVVDTSSFTTPAREVLVGDLEILVRHLGTSDPFAVMPLPR